MREIAGVDPDLMRCWSSRRAAIDTHRADLTAAFQAEHGRPPTPAEAIGLAQQATLATRQRKHAPRSEAEQRATWRGEAPTLLGPDGIAAMFDRSPATAPSTPNGAASCGRRRSSASVSRAGCSRSSRPSGRPGNPPTSHGRKPTAADARLDAATVELDVATAVDDHSRRAVPTHPTPIA